MSPLSIPVERLLDGVLHTLETEVLPDVGTSFARGQIHCAIDVLANLRGRVEEKAALHAADAEGAEAALAAAAERLRAAGHAEAARTVDAARAAAPPEPPAERAAALRRAVVEALGALAALPEKAAAPAHEALRGYLVPQVVRDVAPLVPSRLGQIARG